MATIHPVTDHVESPQPAWRKLFPFESHWCDVEGFRLHYVDEGAAADNVEADTTKGARPTLVLVHGNPTWSFYWREMIAAWSKHYRVLAIDHLGCGLSDKPETGPYLLADRVRHLSQFIEQLDLQNVTLVGHDWGGAIATGAAQALPERVTKIVLLNTGAFRAPRIPFRIAVCRWPIVGPLGVRGMNGFLRAAFMMGLERRERMTPTVRAGYLAPYNNWANRVAIQRFVDDIPMNAAHLSYATLVQIEQGLAAMKLPKLLIWGMRDWCFTPWFLERFLQSWPDAQVLKLPHAGHWVIEDAPSEVANEVLRFLQS